MIDIEIEDWEKESGCYLDKGKKVRLLTNDTTYEISDITSESLLLKPIPYFKNQPAQEFEITFDEVLKAFNEGILTIDGFEGNDLKSLKIAISSVKRKISVAEKDTLLQEKLEQLKKLSSEKEEKKKVQEQEQERLNQDKLKRLEEADAMENKLIEIEILLND